MSLAAETRAAVRSRPWLLRALRSGVVNYAAAAETLDVDGDRESVATALRRFAEDLSAPETAERDATVRMRSGVGLAGVDVDPGDSDVDGTKTDADGSAVNGSDPESILSVGDERILNADGDLTAIVADGDVDARALSSVVERLGAENVVVDAGAVAGDTLVVVVPRTDGANALRIVEDALASVPTI